MRLVDPELRDVLTMLPALGGLSIETLPTIRAALSGERKPCLPGSSIDFAPITFPGIKGAPAVSAILYRPRETPGRRPAVLNIHGGGYVAGDMWREHATMLVLAEALDCVILSIDYRLAPETPWPGPSDDCLAALRWLHNQADELDIDRSRIAVRGVSAGGGLAAGLALRARGRAEPSIAYLMLVYPMLDNRTGSAPHVGEHVWTDGANAFGWSAFLGDKADDPPAEAVPARASDLGGFPPTFIGVGAIDLFSAENLAFAARLIAAGVPTEAHVYPGAYHGFNLVAGARVAQAFMRDSIAALSRAFEETEL